MVAISEQQDRSPLNFLDRATPDHVITWANRPRILTEYIRDNANSYQVDASKVVLGYAIDVIEGDDKFIPQVGGKLESQLSEQNPKAIERARTYQRTIMERLNWESSLPELPNGVREALSGVLGEVQQ